MIVPLVSVVVLAYNVEKYIEKCVFSVLNQGYENIEIICVDDASTDGTNKKLRELVKKFDVIKLITLHTNLGRSEARNTGLLAAKGEYVSFIDGDDEIKKGIYTNLIPVFAEGVDVVWFGIDVVYECHEELKDSDERYYSVKKEGLFNTDISELLNYDCSVCNKIFKRNLLTREYHFSGRYYEDALFCMKFFSESRSVYFAKEKYYIYYRHPVSIMSQTKDGVQGIAINHLYLLDDLYLFFEKKGLLLEKKRAFFDIFSKFFWFSYRNCLPYEKALVISEAVKRLRKWGDESIENSDLLCMFNGEYKVTFCSDFRKELKGLEKIICIRNEDENKVMRVFTLKVASIPKSLF